MKITETHFKRLFYFYTIILVLLAILPINSISPDSALNNIYIISIRLDYLLHFAVFIPWVFLLWKMVGVSFSSNLQATLLYIILGLLFATANEAVQYLLPYRAFNINDLLANGLGVLLGSVLFLKDLS